MPVPTHVHIDVRFLVEVDGRLLLRPATGWPGWLELPGGPVADREIVSAAVTRLLPTVISGVAGVGGLDGVNGIDAADFIACVEHGDPAVPRDHSITVLYAVAAGAVPVAAPGSTLVEPQALTNALGVPPPVADAVVRWTQDGWPSWHGLAAPGAEPWWNGLRRSVRSVRAQLAARRAHLADVEFRDAAVAMCALVAAADGTIDDRERAAMLDSMAQDAVLAQFDAADVERLFASHVDRLRADPDAGRRAAHRDIARLRDRPGQARSVVALGGVIGRADGVFDPLERAAVRDAADVLDVSAADFAVQSVGGTDLDTTRDTTGETPGDTAEDAIEEAT